MQNTHKESKHAFFLHTRIHTIYCKQTTPNIIISADSHTYSRANIHNQRMKNGKIGDHRCVHQRIICRQTHTRLFTYCDIVTYYMMQQPRRVYEEMITYLRGRVATVVDRNPALKREENKQQLLDVLNDDSVEAGVVSDYESVITFYT